MSEQVSSTRKLVSASALMASGTLISRILGLARVMLVAFILGNSTRQADIYSLATTVPNSLYILFAGGALNTVLVPQIVRAIKNDDDGGEAYVNRIMTAFLLIVGIVAIVVTVGAPVVTWIYSGQNWHTPEMAAHYQSMVTLTALCLPQVFFYGMFFLFAQVLNARDKFGPMMWAPILNNVVAILVMVLYLIVWGHADTGAPFTTPQLLVLGIGSTLGIVTQAVVLVPFMRKVGFRYRPRFDLKGTGLRHTFVLTKWTVGFVAVNQLTLVLVQKLATSATANGQGAGATIYSNAYLLNILPHSLVTVSLATAMLPNSSRLAASGDHKGVADECVKTTRLALVLLVPSAVGFMALATPIARLLFGHGAAAPGAPLLAWTLAAFAVGLVPFTIQYVCLRTFYSLEDTRTPFYLQVIIAGLNAVLALVLVVPFNAPNWVAPALALSHSLSYAVGVVISLRRLRGHLPTLAIASIVRHTTQLVVAAAVGGVAAFFAGRWLAATIGGTLGNLTAVLGGLVVLGGFYFGVARLLHVSELNGLVGLLKQRFRRGQSAPANSEPAADLDDISEIMPAVDANGQPLVGGERLFDDDEYRRPADLDDWDAPTTVRPERALEDSVPHFEPTISDEHRIVESGDVLAGRYRLEDKLMRRVETETWRAFDQVLSRLVLVQIMPAGAPRIDEVLSAARKGAIATDSRFLRVLDAVAVTPDPDNPASLNNRVGAFVVSEYAPGQSLEELLQTGPLSALEAAWIVRELADALSTMHAQGLFHEQLNPDTVVITASGNVKIVGFGIESALTGPWDEGRTWSQREAGDVKALGKLLYASLVRRWPGSAGWHLKAAPTDEQGDVLTPRQVRAGVSPVLDAVCDQVLSERPRHNEAPLRTASQIVVALTKVLGTADASNDLAHRLRYPIDPVSDPSAEESTPFVDDATQPIAVQFVEHDDGELDPNKPLEIAPPVLRAEPEPHPPSRRWLLVLVAMVLTTLVIALAWVAVDASRRQRGEVPAGTETTAGAPASPGASPDGGGDIKIAAAKDFDPKADGGNDEESPTTVGAAIDGDPNTGWSTLGYKTAAFGKLKPGVGLVLDLGEAREFKAVKLTMVGEPTGIEIRVPNDAAAAAAPMTSAKDWKVVGANPAALAETQVVLDAPVTSRFVLVYVTSLPMTSGEFPYRATINEVEVLG